MSDRSLTEDDRRPVLAKEAKHWVLSVPGAAIVRIPLANNGLAQQVFEAATRAYFNGSADRLDEIREALGVS